MKYFLLFAPCVVALATPFYNTINPEIAGVPFFYWFQLLLILVSAVLIYVADRIGKAS